MNVMWRTILLFAFFLIIWYIPSIFDIAVFRVLQTKNSWLAGWLAGWLAVWLPACLAGWLPGLLPGWHTVHMIAKGAEPN